MKMQMSRKKERTLPGIGGAMALDYDSYKGILWVGADDGYGNISAQIVFNGTDKPAVNLVNPPAEMGCNPQ